MTVGALIELLQKLPRTYKVEITDCDGDVVELNETGVTNMDELGRRKAVYIG